MPGCAIIRPTVTPAQGDRRFAAFCSAKLQKLGDSTQWGGSRAPAVPASFVTAATSFASEVRPPRRSIGRFAPKDVNIPISLVDRVQIAGARSSQWAVSASLDFDSDDSAAGVRPHHTRESSDPPIGSVSRFALEKVRRMEVSAAYERLEDPNYYLSRHPVHLIGSMLAGVRESINASVAERAISSRSMAAGRGGGEGISAAEVEVAWRLDECRSTRARFRELFRVTEDDGRSEAGEEARTQYPPSADIKAFAARALEESRRLLQGSTHTVK